MMANNMLSRLQSKLQYASYLDAQIQEKYTLLIPQHCYPSITEIIQQNILNHAKIAHESGVHETILSRIKSGERKLASKQYKKLGKIVIREYRIYKIKLDITNRGLKKEYVAKKIGMSQVYFSMILTGARVPKDIDQYLTLTEHFLNCTNFINK